MEKLARGTGDRAGVPACHDVTAAGNTFINPVCVAGLIYLVLLSTAVIGDKLHRDLIEPAVLNKPIIFSFLLRSHFGNFVRVVLNTRVVHCIPDITPHQLEAFGYTVPYSLRIALEQIPVAEVEPSGDVVFLGFLSFNAGVKQITERAQAAADRPVPALVRVHKALVGLIAQQLGNVTLYLLFVEVAYRADDIALKLSAGVLHDGSTGNGVVQPEHAGIGAQPAGCRLPCLDVLVGQISSVHLALEPGKHAQVVLPLSGEPAGESLVLILLGSHLSEGIIVHAVDFLRDVPRLVLDRLSFRIVVRVLVGSMRADNVLGRYGIAAGTDLLPGRRKRKRLTRTALGLRHHLPDRCISSWSRRSKLLRLLKGLSETFFVRFLKLSLQACCYLCGRNLLLFRHVLGKLGLRGLNRLLPVHALKRLLCRFSAARLDIVQGDRRVETVNAASLVNLFKVLGIGSVLGGGHIEAAAAAKLAETAPAAETA